MADEELHETTADIRTICSPRTTPLPLKRATKPFRMPLRKPPSIPLLTNPLIPTTMTITTFRWIASKRC